MNKPTKELWSPTGERVRVTPGGEDEATWRARGYTEQLAVEPSVQPATPLSTRAAPRRAGTRGGVS